MSRFPAPPLTRNALESGNQSRLQMPLIRAGAGCQSHGRPVLCLRASPLPLSPSLRVPPTSPLTPSICPFASEQPRPDLRGLCRTQSGPCPKKCRPRSTQNSFLKSGSNLRRDNFGFVPHTQNRSQFPNLVIPFGKRRQTRAERFKIKRFVRSISVSLEMRAASEERRVRGNDRDGICLRAANRNIVYIFVNFVSDLGSFSGRATAGFRG